MATLRAFSFRKSWRPGAALPALGRLLLPIGAGLAAAMLAGCGAPPLSYEELQRAVYREPGGELYVANGDELVEGPDALRALYERLVAQGGETATLGRPLIVNRVGGADDRWDTARAQALTYCVSRDGFGPRYPAVVEALSRATAAWESAANVRFVHDARRDVTCGLRSAVVFDVRPVCAGRYLARSFFPSTARAGREVLIDCAAFDDLGPLTLAGLLRHELGHVLGFRHEHTRPEAGVCFEDGRWRALTPYDPYSVMHYPQCNGAGRHDLDLTARDRAGAAALYP